MESAKILEHNFLQIPYKIVEIIFIKKRTIRSYYFKQEVYGNIQKLVLQANGPAIGQQHMLFIPEHGICILMQHN